MKIALLGYGIETQSALRYYSKIYPNAEFAIYDNAKKPKSQLPPGVVFHGGVDNFYDIEADLVIRTPAVAPKRVSTNGVVTSVTKEFFDVCPVPIIGVTGTKGKSTTASLIAAILKKAGIKTWLVGNIGISALDAIDDIKTTGDGVVVYELSSFQLWDMKKSPKVAVLLLIEPEHLNVHDDFTDYSEAKANLVRHQAATDTVVYFADNPTTAGFAEESAGKKIPYHASPEGIVYVNGQEIAKKDEVQLPGDHNIGNIQAAVLAAWQFTQDISAISEAVRSFKGLPHRLEEVAVKNGVRYINDSFSSAPPAVVVATATFSEPEILIMGGYDRGLDFTDTCKRIVAQKNVKKVLLIGQTKDKIADIFEELEWKSYEKFDTLEHVVKKATAYAAQGDVVIFSPGCASFDMFQDFTQRGEKFKSIVAGL